MPREGGGLGLPSVETSAPRAGSDEHAPDTVVSLEGGCGSNGLPSVEPQSPEDSFEEAEEDDGYNTDTLDHDLKSAKVARISHAAFRQLDLQWTYQEELLEAAVTPNGELPCLAVNAILYSKLKYNPHFTWHTAESHQHEGRVYVYVRLNKANMRRFHAKLFGWGLAKVAFCSVRSVIPLDPEPMDDHEAVMLA